MHYLFRRLGLFFCSASALLPVLGFALLIVCCGCKTVSPSGADVTASVTIENSTPAVILKTASEVFRAHGFQVKPSPGYSMVYEKSGSNMSNLLYGGWGTGGVWLRAKVRVAELGTDLCALDCIAVYVRNRGEIGIEEEQAGPPSGQFKEILKEIKANVALTASAPKF